MFDVLIVGGGAIGLSIAWSLAGEGLRVQLIERDKVGQGASYAAGGMLCPISEAHTTEETLLALGLESMKRYPAFVEELESIAETTVSYNNSGTLIVGLDRDEMRVVERLYLLQKKWGLPVDRLDGDQCRELCPMLSHRTVGGLFASEDHQIDNRLLCLALAKGLKKRGVVIKEHTPVQNVNISKNRVVSVETPTGTIQTGKVVLAAGAWSRQIKGIPDEALPPVRPVKGQIIHLKMDSANPIIEQTIRSQRGYCIPRKDGRLLIGATSEEQNFDENPTAGGIYELLKAAYEILPGTYELPFIEYCTGFRPGTPDNLPILGPGPIEGLYYATGHYRHGILLTPVTAWAIAKTIVNGQPPKEISRFLFERFTGNSCQKN
jgi:glycine oxidase